MKLTEAQIQLLTEIIREQISKCAVDLAVWEDIFYVKKLNDLETIRDYIWQITQESKDETN